MYRPPSGADIDEIGLSSARLANLVGRTETNASDVQCALEDLGVDLKLLRHFIRSTDDGAFPKGTQSPSLRQQATHRQCLHCSLLIVSSCTYAPAFPNSAATISHCAQVCLVRARGARLDIQESAGVERRLVVVLRIHLFLSSTKTYC